MLPCSTFSGLVSFHHDPPSRSYTPLSTDRTMPRRVGDPFEAELPVGDPSGEAGRDYPHRKISTNDAPAQLGLDRLDIRGDAGVADTVAEVTDNSPGRAVDLVRVLSRKARRRDRS